MACGRDDAVGATRPDDRNLLHLVGAATALVDQHLAERTIGDDPGVVVDATVALGLADDGDDAVGLDDSSVDELGQAGGVADVLDGNLAYLDRVGHSSLLGNSLVGRHLSG